MGKALRCCQARRCSRQSPGTHPHHTRLTHRLGELGRHPQRTHVAGWDRRRFNADTRTGASSAFTYGPPRGGLRTFPVELAESNVFCPHCGDRFAADDQFCGACGRVRVRSARTQPEPQLPSPRAEHSEPSTVEYRVVAQSSVAGTAVPRRNRQARRLVLGAAIAGIVMTSGLATVTDLWVLPQVLTGIPPRDQMLAMVRPSVSTVHVIGGEPGGLFLLKPPTQFEASGSGRSSTTCLTAASIRSVRSWR